MCPELWYIINESNFVFFKVAFDKHQLVSISLSQYFRNTLSIDYTIYFNIYIDLILKKLIKTKMCVLMLVI